MMSMNKSSSARSGRGAGSGSYNYCRNIVDSQDAATSSQPPLLPHPSMGRPHQRYTDRGAIDQRVAHHHHHSPPPSYHPYAHASDKRRAAPSGGGNEHERGRDRDRERGRERITGRGGQVVRERRGGEDPTMVGLSRSTRFDARRLNVSDEDIMNFCKTPADAGDEALIFPMVSRYEDAANTLVDAWSGNE